ncbi:hypothetical protein OG943_25600 [Amycolatopsis sp. NBC_00345]
MRHDDLVDARAPRRPAGGEPRVVPPADHPFDLPPPTTRSTWQA